MTHLAKLFEEEKIEAINNAVFKARKETLSRYAKCKLENGADIWRVMHFTKLTRAELDEMMVSWGMAENTWKGFAQMTEDELCLIEEAKMDAVNTATRESIHDERLRIAQELLELGIDPLYVMKITLLTHAELDALPVPIGDAPLMEGE
jgi:predicted transposase YdaD